MSEMVLALPARPDEIIGWLVQSAVYSTHNRCT